MIVVTVFEIIIDVGILGFEVIDVVCFAVGILIAILVKFERLKRFFLLASLLLPMPVKVSYCRIFSLLMPGRNISNSVTRILAFVIFPVPLM